MGELSERQEKRGIRLRKQSFMFHTLIPLELAEKMDEVVSKYKITYSHLLRVAVEEYIKKLEEMEKKESNAQ
jgi:metal-responsive CopG/Arc/MetJ family transcriptional regulator